MHNHMQAPLYLSLQTPLHFCSRFIGQILTHGITKLQEKLDGLSEWMEYLMRAPPQVALAVRNLLADAGDARDVGLIPWVGKIPWRRPWQPTPVFLPGESHGQRSLAGYST